MAERIHLAIVDYYLDLSLKHRLYRENLEEAHHFAAVADMLISLPFHMEQMKRAPSGIRVRKQLAKFVGTLFYNANQGCSNIKRSIQNHDYLNAFGPCCDGCQLIGYKEAERFLGFAVKGGVLEHDGASRVLAELKTQICLMERSGGEKQFLQLLDQYFDTSDYTDRCKSELADRKLYLKKMVTEGGSNLGAKLSHLKQHIFTDSEFERISRTFLLEVYLGLEPPCVYEWSNIPYPEKENKNTLAVNPFEGQVMGGKTLKNLIAKNRPYASQPAPRTMPLAEMEASNERFQSVIQDPLPGIVKEMSSGPSDKRSYIMKHDSAQRLVFDDESEDEGSSKRVKSSSVSPASSKGNSSKKRNPYTKEEEDLIIEGYRTYGNAWETIRRRYNLLNRSGSDIKDKVRNLRKRGVLA